MARLAVLGMGPVGLATAWDLLQRENEVHVIDTDSKLVRDCRAGHFPRVPQIYQDLRSALLAPKERALHLHEKIALVPEVEAVVVCVGTPPAPNGFHLRPLIEAMTSLDRFQFSRISRHIILRSTLMPTTIDRELLPALEKAFGWKKNVDFAFSYFPEFLREKFIRDDLNDPPLRVAAHSSSETALRFTAIFPHTTRTLDFATAETLKLACNAFHSLKVAFANEMAGVCEAAGVSAQGMMDLFCEDTKLNISSKYLRPGGAFGGPCLEKDLIALEGFVKTHDINGQLIASIRASNRTHAAAREAEFSSEAETAGVGLQHAY